MCSISLNDCCCNVMKKEVDTLVKFPICSLQPRFRLNKNKSLHFLSHKYGADNASLYIMSKSKEHGRFKHVVFPSGAQHGFVLKQPSVNFRFCFTSQYAGFAHLDLASPSPLCLWVSPPLNACTSRPGETFLACVIGTATCPEDDGLHTGRIHRRFGPGCCGERAVREGGIPGAAAAADRHWKSGRGSQDGPGDEDNRQLGRRR